MQTDFCSRLRALATSALSDVMRRMRLDPRAMHPDMKPVWAGAEVCGPAFTVRSYPGATYGCDLALAQARPGEVIILAAGGITDVIMWGEIFSTCAQRLGLGGTVIDGAARDVAGIRDVCYPVFARAISPRGGTFDKDQSETQLAVSCAGVVVQPGDWIRGDETGVVVIPSDRTGEILDQAEAHACKEVRMLELARSGTPMAEIRQIIAREFT